MRTELTLLMAALIVSGFGCGGEAKDDGGSAAGSSGSPGGRSGNASTAGSVALSSCDPTTEEAGAPGASTERAPLNHRSSPCAFPTRGPGPGTQPYSANEAGHGADGGVLCTADSECNAGTNGRCFPWEGLVGPGGCSYDECLTDSDCPPEQPCVSRNSPSDYAANECAPPGNCKVDSDCGSGGYCSPSVSQATCFGSSPYFCHTALDACLDDADCPAVTAAYAQEEGLDAHCAYDSQLGHWACSQYACLLP